MRFIDLILAYLPYGALSRQRDSYHYLEQKAYAAVLEDELDARIDDLLDEIWPSTATETLEDWERVLDLHPPTGVSVAARRALIKAALRKRPAQTVSYIEDVVGTQAQCTATVLEYHPLFYGVATYWSSSYVGLLVFKFLVAVPRLCATAKAVDYDAIQHTIDQIKPAHTEGVFVIDDARYHDPYSLYNQCVYGVV